MDSQNPVVIADVGVAANLESRLELFRLRTTTLGVTAAVAVVAGVFLVLAQSLQLLDVLGTGDAVRGLPAFHIPSELLLARTGGSGLRVEIVQLALLFVWVSGIWGISTDRLIGLKKWGWAVILVALAGIALNTQYAEHKLTGISASELHQTIAAKQWDAAEALVRTGPDSLVRTYVLAQIALQSGDARGLLQYGQPVVDNVDAALMNPNSMDADQALKQLKEVRPEVVYALEMALYGAPRTSVGIALFKSQRSAREYRRILQFPLWGLAAACTLLITAGMGLWLWLQMLRRVHRLHAWLHQTE